MVVGYFVNESTLSNIDFFVITIFDYLLYVFLFVMGTRVAKRIGELKGKGVSLIVFALITPLFGSFVALLAGLYFGLSVGNTSLLMVLTASASYIAVPSSC